MAERAEDAPGLRGGGDEGGHFLGFEHGAELCGDGGGSGDEADEPGEAARERRTRAGAARARGFSRPGGAGGEAGEAGAEAAEALPDEDDDRPGDAVFQPRGGDVRAERLDEGFEAGEQKSGGCGGWGGHGIKNPMRRWGWARIFVSFAPVVAWLAIGQNSGGLGGNGVTRAGSYDSGPQCAHSGRPAFLGRAPKPTLVGVRWLLPKPRGSGAAAPESRRCSGVYIIASK